ncbi:unnamed protein product [Lupinus luteus]|uniref:acetolactate synthase n=1 Tax=Lupinus luteus TaxID=3873 RepID=A0AAV1XDX7_LUPLU
MRVCFITLKGAKEIECPNDVYILDQAEEEDIYLPYSRRPGSYSSCAGKVKEGTMDQTDATSTTAAITTDVATVTTPTTVNVITTTSVKPFVSRFADDEPRKGADILIEALERQGVTTVFAYPGGASLEIHQALTRSTIIRNILPRHEQGGVFATEGYARSSGLVGVCMSTSGPGATNLVSGLANAMSDSIPLVVITGQVPRCMIGTDAFQETPIVEVTRSITKYSYLVLDVDDIPRVVNEAFMLAISGRPGPVPNEELLDQIVGLISESKKPVMYVGGGCLNSSKELIRFVELTGIHVASTLMGLGVYPAVDEYSLRMLGMHGTICANYAVENSDLLLAFGVRFDDRVTGKVEAFASRAKIVHIDIDSAELGKNKKPWISVFADVKNAIQILDELTNGNAIITTGVGQHQMWATQFYKYKRPRQWLTSAGLGAMGFGLPAAIGTAVANPNSIVIDIDGDGSFMMNVQELTTIRVENLPIKIMLLNNQHLGMVVQWEDMFYKSNRGHTYLGDPTNETEILPNMLKFAEACDIPAARVTKTEDLRAAIQKMLDTPGPYMLDVIIHHEEHILPMIPANQTFKDTITEGDDRRSY